MIGTFLDSFSPGILVDCVNHALEAGECGRFLVPDQKSITVLGMGLLEGDDLTEGDSVTRCVVGDTNLISGLECALLSAQMLDLAISYE
jgi:hypothetical protein